jgi:hypothetical protein
VTIETHTTTFKKHKKYWVLCGIALLIAILWFVISFTLLDENWLKTQVEKYVLEKYQTDIKIESLEFSPWKGRAKLSDITLERSEENRLIQASIGSIDADLEILPLLYRDIEIEQLTISQPALTVNVERKPESPTEDTLTRLQRAAILLACEILIRPLIEFIVEVLEIFVGNIETAINIEHLVIHQGSVNYTANRKDSEPFSINLRAIEYSAKNINARLPLEFVADADIRAEIVTAQGYALFTQDFSEIPLTLSISQIDLGYLDRHLKQKDILEIKNGTMQADFLVENEKGFAKISFNDLELSQNTNAVHKDFMFIPAERLINYVEEAGGDLALNFEFTKKDVHTSRDLEFVVLEAWEGMWKEILKKVSSEELKQLKDKTTDKLMNFFKKTTPSPNDTE